MFKRLVSNLPYSPALIGQVGFYAGRLRREEVTRRLGLIFTALALVVQTFAVFSPPDAQATASRQNIIYQGFNNKAELLEIYDAGVDQTGNKDIQQIFSYFGINRENLVAGKIATFNSRDFDNKIWSVGRKSYDAGTSHEKAYRIADTDTTTVYARKLSRFDSLPVTQDNGSSYRSLIGERDNGSWFAVALDSGNIAYTEFTKPLDQDSNVAGTSSLLGVIPSVTCDNLGISLRSCEADFIESKSAANISRSSEDATKTIAEPGNKIEYTLTVKNDGNKTEEYRIRDDFSDVLEYAEIIDTNGGELEIGKNGSKTGFISWPAEKIAPNKTVSKLVSVEVKQYIPATPQNQGNPESHNCIMTNTFGNTTNVRVQCPPTKQVEQVVKQLPTTNTTANLVFGGVLLLIVAYFWARARQLRKEVKLLRKEFAGGGL